ncbi:hypothetical protein BN1195_04394 [Chryseobacterium oranimense G311]|uniref:DUF4365 domain-containing protein n=1 Tax=Chryseobacterium oranimense TaxID=421058 RepID=UPI000533B531|nr:DUF4365 domain-containing protein [Chryseobacterium oranimense]CEJ72037.1 hypothetical protein BN1195_04394 [Chryseobacterium oranimense G311]
MKKKDNKHIRKDANNLLTNELRDLFFKKDMMLGEHPSTADEDMGIDFFFEVLDENNCKHLFLFYNQNKGTDEEIKIIKTKTNKNFGKISFPLSIRHAEYFYYELEESLIFTLCDIKSKKIYWYDIQNDSTLPNRIAEQINANKKSIQIYIPSENILNEDSFDKLLDEIKYSKINQIRKKRILSENIEADYSKIKNDTEDKNIIDKIDYTLKLFDGIKVLPTNVICQLYPFRGTEYNTYINEFELYTDNEEFFDFMDNIDVVDNEFELKSKEVLVENQKEKLKNIISFLQVNHIEHIRWRGKNRKEQVCVHKLYQYGKCDCERCNLERLNIKRTKIKLEETIPLTTNYEKLRRGYTYYLLGDYKKSIEVFLNIYNEAEISKNPVIYTVSTYNLMKLRRLLKFSYYEDDKKDILNKISHINFNIDEPLINRKAPYFLDVFRGIKERWFYEDIKDDIENSFTEIQKLHFNDKYGGWNSHNGYDKLRSTFLRFTTYLEHNFIIFNHNSEFKNLSKKVLESIFALYTLNNPLSDKYKKFDWNIIEMWIFNVEEDYSKFLLRKYGIKNIEIEGNLMILERMNELVENLIDSNEYINDLNGLFKPLRIEKTLSKIVLITSLLDIDFNEKKKIITSVVNLCKILENKHSIPFDKLVEFVEINEKEIDKNLTKEIIDLFFLDEHERFGFGRILNIYSEKSSETEIENLIKSLLKVENLKDIEIDLSNRYLGKLFYSFTFLNDNYKDLIKNKIIEKLNKEFDDKLYNLVAIYDLIGFDDKLFQKFILTIPDKSNLDNDNYPFRSSENFRLGQAMNLIFKYNIDITDEIKSLAKKSHPDYFEYYCWLMDIDNYDYTKFNPYWILEHQTVHYFNRFKKSPKLKDEISKSLKENYVEGIAKIYIEELV